MLTNIISCHRVSIDGKLYWLNGLKSVMDINDPLFYESREFLRRFIGSTVQFDVVYERESNVYIDLYLPKQKEFELVNSYLVRQGYCQAIGKGYEQDESAAKNEKLGIHGVFNTVVEESTPSLSTFTGCIEKILSKSILVRGIVNKKHYIFKALWSGINIEENAKQFLEQFVVLRPISITIDALDPTRVTITHTNGIINKLLLEKKLATPDYRLVLPWLPITTTKQTTEKGLKVTKIINPMTFKVNEKVVYLSGIKIVKEVDSLDAMDCLLHVINQPCTFTLDKKQIVNDQEREYGVLQVNNQYPSLLLVKNGFATVFKPRKDEVPNFLYPQLLEAEQQAIKNKTGIHGNYIVNPYVELNKPAPKYNLQKNGKMSAMIMFQISPTKFKVRLLKERLIIVVQLGGIRVPRDVVIEPLPLTKVFIEIESFDQCFQGYMYINNQLYQLDLVTKGQAIVLNNNSSFYNQLKSAENVAKNKSIGVWNKPIEQSNKVYTIQSATHPCVVTEFNGEEGYLQLITQEIHDLPKITQILNSSPLVPFTNTNYKNKLCACLLDKKYYRAKLLKKNNDAYSVFFVDFGHVFHYLYSQLQYLHQR